MKNENEMLEKINAIIFNSNKMHDKLISIRRTLSSNIGKLVTVRNKTNGIDFSDLIKLSTDTGYLHFNYMIGKEKGDPEKIFDLIKSNLIIATKKYFELLERCNEIENV